MKCILDGLYIYINIYDDLAQECYNSVANAQQLPQSVKESEYNSLTQTSLNGPAILDHTDFVSWEKNCLRKWH